ncbi:MAG: hypothetical protein ACKOBA_08735, partial [Limnohabitans sp.]
MVDQLQSDRSALESAQTISDGSTLRIIEHDIRVLDDFQKRLRAERSEKGPGLQARRKIP